MSVEKVDTLIIGGGQAGLAMSEHLRRNGLPHLILERGRIAESWRSRRWDSLVANGPAWHDRFPGMTFAGVDPDGFPSKDQIVEYFENYAEQIEAPLREGVEVTSVQRRSDDAGFLVETSEGSIEANQVVAATGPFQVPHMPDIVPASSKITQIHSNEYRNPEQLPDGAVLIVGAGSSGVQIADELLRSSRRVFLSVGPHNRPPRRYRGRDFCWWLGVLGKWNARTPDRGTEHVTIAVSGARGGHTIDFRELASSGMQLLGRAESFENGTMHFAPDLAANIAAGDADYLSLLHEADAYVAREGLDLPEEPGAREFSPDPEYLGKPILELKLDAAGISSIIWATGFSFDFNWIRLDVFDERGRPNHKEGVSSVPGLYFLGLPWLSRRGSAFIWGVWHDAGHLADHIAARRSGAHFHSVLNGV